jgi:hypothetical protein
LQQLEARASAVAKNFNPQEVSNTLWAFAKLARTPGAGLLQQLEARASAVAQDFNPQEVSNTLWAFSLFFHHLTEGMVSSISKHWLSNPDAESFSKQGLCQIHQFLLSCDLELSQSQQILLSSCRLKAALSSKALDAFAPRDVTVSKLQQQVEDVLQSIGAQVQGEAVDARSLYSIDCLVLGWGKEDNVKIALEVDGPSHFVCESTESGIRRAPNGGTIMKRRHLSLLGYAVASVPYWEWNDLRDVEAKKAYLRAKLHDAVHEKSV